MDESFENTFFQNVTYEHLEMDILSDMWHSLQQEFRSNGWTDEDGLRYTLAAGLAALQGKRFIEQLADKDADIKAAMERLQYERLQLEGRYAVMKYRAFHFMQAVKLLEMKLNVCHTQVEGLRQLNQQLQQRLSQLTSG